MKEYKDINGFIYTHDEINDAIKGSTVSFDDYLNARGLKLYDRFSLSNLTFGGRGDSDVMIQHPEFGVMSKQKLLTEHRPDLDKVVLKYPEYKKEELRTIDHASTKKFLEKSAFVFGGSILSASQEKRVVNYLNEAYSQYDDINFEEAEAGYDTVRLILGDKENPHFVKDYNLEYDQDDNKRIWENDIKNDIDNYINPTVNTTKELNDLADQATAVINKYKGDFWAEENAVPELRTVLGSDWEVEEAIAGANAIKLTNPNGASRTFYLQDIWWSEHSESHTAINDFIKRNVNNSEGHIKQEMEFGQMFDEKFLTEEVLTEMVGDTWPEKIDAFFGAYEGIPHNYKEEWWYKHGMTENARKHKDRMYQKQEEEGGVEAEKKRRRRYANWREYTEQGADELIDILFDEMGIDSGWFWFDEDSDLRDQFDLLTEDDLKRIIKSRLQNRQIKEAKQHFYGKLAPEKFAEFEDGIDDYYKGEGLLFKDGQWVEGEATEEERQVNSAKDFLRLFNIDAVKTLENYDLRRLGEANLKLMRDDLTEDERKKWITQRNVALENLPEFVQFLNEDGTRNLVPKKTAHLYQKQNPNSINKEDDIKIHEHEIKSGLLGDAKSDFDILESGYNNNVMALLKQEELMNKKYHVRYEGEDRMIDRISTMKEIISAYDKGAAMGMGIEILGVNPEYDGKITYRKDGTPYKYKIKSTPIKESKEFEESLNLRRIIEMRRNDYQTLLDRHEAYKRLYLLNQDPTGIEKSHWETAGALSLGSIIGGDNYKELFGMTERDVIDETGSLMGHLGF